MESDSIRYYRRNLPHFHPKTAIFFLTYRLHFSLPNHILKQIAERRRILNRKVIAKELTPLDKDKLLFNYFDALLDQENISPAWLANYKAAQIVIESLLHFHKINYELICTVVMPNHVHTLLRTAENEFEKEMELLAILTRHKKYTARQINKLLNRKGQFWQHESYDHVVRDEKSLYKIIEYILLNPVKAGLVDDFRKWPHYWLNPDYAQIE